MADTFFCKGHLTDLPIAQLSPVYPFCQACFDYMMEDGSLDYLIRAAKKYLPQHQENAVWLAAQQGGGKPVQASAASQDTVEAVATVPGVHNHGGKARRTFATEDLAIIDDLTLSCRDAAGKIGVHFSTVSRLRKKMQQLRSPPSSKV